MSSSESGPRVVVTAHAKDGASVFASDKPAEIIYPFGPAASSFAVLDVRGSVPVNNQEPVNASAGGGIPRAPPGGVLFTITNVPPGGEAPMHRTETIDYAIVMAGEIVLILDNGKEKTIKAGEYIIQGGANHAWKNRGQDTCRIAIVMVAADKVKLEDGMELSATYLCAFSLRHVAYTTHATQLSLSPNLNSTLLTNLATNIEHRARHLVRESARLIPPSSTIHAIETTPTHIMASSPVTTPAENAVSPAVSAKGAKPPTDESSGETHGEHDSGSATSLSNTSSSTRRLEDTSDTETTPPGQATAEHSDAPVKGSEELKEAQGEPLDQGAVGEGTDVAASPPPLPDEPLPEEQGNNDGWDPMWSEEHQAWYFHNRITQQTQWENPRVPVDGAAASAVAGGYNPAIHGDYDPTAWYATGGVAAPEEVDDKVDRSAAIAAAAAAAAAVIQSTDPSTFRGSRLDVESGGGHRYTNDAKSGRQLNAFFDVAATSNDHDGRSLKAERSGKKPSKAELKAFKEKRRAKKEEKRRAWLRD
ncbi:ww domain-containing protein [Ophiostoma piceae UAMH 11346]|uniref:Ww domain-containing protein n=1 Tax=Ophiostoma piceae (strain UAMH 11346) TaxID=1262450 RepID=S3CU81_OPHP1|nr:ww domain-containing protein [Ophiostoma piceae UAMH 11346]